MFILLRSRYVRTACREYSNANKLMMLRKLIITLSENLFWCRETNSVIEFAAKSFWSLRTCRSSLQLSGLTSSKCIILFSSAKTHLLHTLYHTVVFVSTTCISRDLQQVVPEVKCWMRFSERIHIFLQFCISTNIFTRKLDKWCSTSIYFWCEPVSYTHLTLPTT